MDVVHWVSRLDVPRWYRRPLGLNRAGTTLRLNPCFPKAWPKLSATITLGNALIAITILNPEGTGHGVAGAELDGIALSVSKGGVTLPPLDGQHDLIVTLGSEALV